MSNINNNAKKKHSSERKTSSRVTPKIREYLAEIANEREVDLERFMILSSSSPASSGVSVGALSFNMEAAAATTTATTKMRSSSSCCRSRSRSHSHASGLGLGVPAAVSEKRTGDDEEVKITNIPIVMEKEKQQPKKAISVEDLRTPTKCTQTDMEMGTEKKTESRKTQTPESALKSHKRLEWDPAADVGYHLSCERAVSTSNISTLERSVLEAATTLQRPNQSETDLNRLKGTTAKGATKTAPPLASSTLVNRSAGNQTQMAPLPSSSSRSRRESCATSAASSFDYHHNNNSRPSTAGNSNSTTSTRHSLSAEELLRHMEQQRQEREYSAQLEQVLSRRRQVANKENQQPKKQNKSKNSGNHSCGSSNSSASSSCAVAKNDLDLGIDLLCSLVNKRSLSQSQKKQLAKEIIKRLVGFEMISSSRSSTRNSNHNSGNNSNNRTNSQHKEQAQQTEQNQARGKDIATNTSRRSSLILPRSKSPPTEQLHHLVVPVPAPRTRLAATPTDSSPVQATCSYASTSSGASNDLVTQKTNPPAADKGKSTDAAEQLAMQEYLNPMTQSEIEYEQKRQQRDNLSMERRTQIDWIDAEIRRLSALQNLLRRSGRGDQHQWKTQGHEEEEEDEQEVQQEIGQRLPPAAGGGHPAPPAPPVTPVFMPGRGVEKGAKGKAGDGADGRIADGRTSSGASSGAGAGTQRTSSGASSGAGAGTQRTSSGASSGAGAPSAASSGAGTATGFSSGASSGAGGATGVPLGEGTAAAAASEIQAAPSGATPGAEVAVATGAATETEGPLSAAGVTSSGTSSGAGEVPTRATKATAAPPPPPALPAPAVVAPAVRLRSKMATPTLSHSGSSESVCSFVQQRQRQFLAHYQNQQQQRLEQQQQLFMLQQQQQLIHRQQQQQQQQHLHAACHMSQQRQQHCPHHYQQRQQQQPHQQHYVQMQYAQAVGNSYSCLDDGAVYYHVLSSQGVKDVATATATVATATKATTTATVATAAAGIMGNSCNSTSSSSLLCLSSEMSIPMGGVSNACEATTTTTTTTTTHQYDDVACQQMHLQLQQQRRQQQQQHRRQHLVEPQPMKIKQQMLQMRPRGIAYMLQFTSSSDHVGRVLHESLTVQDYLQLARPKFCAQSKQRKAILNQMQLLRNARRRELDELILVEGNSLETIDRQLQQLPPPVTSKVRIFSTKEMKALTNKRCEKLPEVLAAQNREREERRRRSNRIMRDVFNRRLQRRVRSGKLSLNHSRTVI